MDPLYTMTDLPQADVLWRLRKLHFADARTHLDPTYGGGGFYPYSDDEPTCGGDYQLSRAKDVVLNYEQLPFAAAAFDLVTFDPPFQPTTQSTVVGKIDARFTKLPRGVWGVQQSVTAGLHEARRVARLGVIVKVQDYIHSHRPVWMSRWVWDALGDPYDVVYVRQPSPKMKALNWSTPRSVWRNHSTFYVYRWKSQR